MPDVQKISDPFATASVDKEVNKIVWDKHQVSIHLQNLNADFYVRGLNKDNTVQVKATAHSFAVKPGTYLLSNSPKITENKNIRIGTIGLNEFVAPLPVTLKNPLKQDAAKYERSRIVSGQPIVLFDAAKPPLNLNFYLGEWDKNSYAFIPATTAQKAVLEITHAAEKTKRNGGLEIYIRDFLSHQTDLATYHYLVIRINASQALPSTVNLISGSARSFGTNVQLSASEQEIKIPLSTLAPHDFLLLPRPYPGFQPLYFQSAATEKFNLSAVEKLQISYQLNDNTAEKINISAITLEK